MAVVQLVQLVGDPYHLFSRFLTINPGVPSKYAGPNGSQDFLNCGINSASGWNPPDVNVNNIIAKDLSQAVSESGSPFKACSKYISTIEKYANKYGVPPILIASISMQESSCNAETVGGAGEQGLMQLTKDKCGKAPGGNCKDPDYNIHTGTAYFKSLLDANNGNIAIALGSYNGWYVGLTKASGFMLLLVPSNVPLAKG